MPTIEDTRHLKQLNARAHAAGKFGETPGKKPKTLTTLGVVNPSTGGRPVSNPSTVGRSVINPSTIGRSVANPSTVGVSTDGRRLSVPATPGIRTLANDGVAATDPDVNLVNQSQGRSPYRGDAFNRERLPLGGREGPDYQPVNKQLVSGGVQGLLGDLRSASNKLLINREAPEEVRGEGLISREPGNYFGFSPQNEHSSGKSLAQKFSGRTDADFERIYAPPESRELGQRNLETGGALDADVNLVDQDQERSPYQRKFTPITPDLGDEEIGDTGFTREDSRIYPGGTRYEGSGDNFVEFEGQRALTPGVSSGSGGYSGIPGYDQMSNDEKIAAKVAADQAATATIRRNTETQRRLQGVGGSRNPVSGSSPEYPRLSGHERDIIEREHRMGVNAISDDIRRGRIDKTTGGKLLADAEKTTARRLALGEENFADERSQDFRTQSAATTALSGQAQESRDKREGIAGDLQRQLLDNEGRLAAAEASAVPKRLAPVSLTEKGTDAAGYEFERPLVYDQGGFQRPGEVQAPVINEKTGMSYTQEQVNQARKNIAATGVTDEAKARFLEMFGIPY